MKNFVLKVCIILSLTVTVFSKNESIKIEMKSRAISSLIDTLHETHHLRFILIVQKNDYHLGKLADRILQLTKSPITVKFIKKLKRYFVEWDYSYFFLVNDEKILIDWKITFAVYTSNNYIFIHPKESNKLTKHPIIDPKNAYKMFLLGESKHNDSLILFNMFRVKPTSCEYEAKIVNTFNFTTRQWFQNKFVQEFNNFYQCPVGVYLYALNDVDPFITKTIQGNVTIYDGISIKVLKLFAAKYNFVVDIHNEYIRTSTQITIIPLSFRRTLGVYGEISTSAIQYEEFTYAVSRGEQYTPFEKLLLPFDLSTWIMVIVTFAIGYLTILILLQFPRNVQQFVFGTDNDCPSLNLTRIFFGIGCLLTPNRNFARVLFMIFTMYCLIIRNAYQGKMFEFLHSNAEKPTPNSREELIQQQTPVYFESPVHFEAKNWTLKSELFLIKDHPIIHPNLNFRFEHPELLWSHFNETQACVVSRKDWKIITKIHHKNRKIFLPSENMKILNEDYEVNELVWFINKETQEVYENLERFILELHQHGIIKHFENVAEMNEIPKPPDPDPQVLTMHMLSAGFIVWLATVTISCVVFMVEHLVKYVTTMRSLAEQ